MLQGQDAFRVLNPRSDRNAAAYQPHAERGIVSEVIGAVSRAMSDDVEARLRAQQVNAIRSLSAAMMATHLVNGAALVLVLWATDQLSAEAIVWAVLLCLVALNALFGVWRTLGRPPPLTTRTRTVCRVVVSALVFGVLWAVPGLAFLPELTGFAAIFAYVVLTGMVAGGAITLYPIPRAAMAFVVPVAVGGVVGLATVHGVLAFGPGLVTALFLFVFHRVIERHSALFVSEFVNRLELEKRSRLIEDLLEDARLEAMGTRQAIEERLAHAQKMDAIGQVTGGIAHNFNNLLTAIQGHAELLRHDGHSDPTLVDPILEGCVRGADQVRRLLSVAGKQILYPETVPLEPLVSGFVRMIEPSLGSRFRVRAAIDADIQPVFVDPTQLENALVNLVLNARDAMKDGGEILIACRSVPARPPRLGRAADPEMVTVSVMDRGTGMDPDTCARAAEPFFTTKTLDQGTGLGLSSVAGFARQSKGDISIESTPGSGTTVTLCLPAALDLGSEAPLKFGGIGTQMREVTVLLVEDFAEVRAATETMLKSLGYRVVSTDRPEGALEIVRSGEHLDVVLTDILLSDEVTGLQLARKIEDLRPGLPVAFVSGWVREDAGATNGPRTRVLPKPFTRHQLDAHVRRALSEEPAEAP